MLILFVSTLINPENLSKKERNMTLIAIDQDENEKPGFYKVTPYK